jgi:hypothetical protein
VSGPSTGITAKEPGAGRGAAQDDPSVGARLSAFASPGRDYTSAVYGSLLVATLLAVEWRQDASTTLVGLSIIIAVVVFWLTHVWSAIVNRRVRGPVGRADVMRLAAVEAPMLTAAVVPLLVLGLGALAFVTVDTAVVLALLASIVQLFLWGLAVGRAAHTSWPLAFAIAAVDCALGVLLVVLKVLVIH